MIDAILKLMPLDTEYCATPLEYMVPDADSGVEMEQCDTWDEAIEAAKRNGYENCAGPIERTKFYEKAGKAVLTVCTSETRPVSYTHLFFILFFLFLFSVYFLLSHFESGFFYLFSF